jgi:hypothetical protein
MVSSLDEHFPEDSGRLVALDRVNVFHDFVERQSRAKRHRECAQLSIRLEGDRVDRDDVSVIKRALGLGFFTAVH